MTQHITAWWTGRLPEEWQQHPSEISVDREEIVVRIGLEAPAHDEPASIAEAARGRISRFREETREARIDLARQAEHRFGRKVAWGATCGDERELFTHLAVPVMTRLRQPERIVLDTLVEAGVARSRADALAWCVRLVGQHSDDWLRQLREAMTSVQQLREQGPAA